MNRLTLAIKILAIIGIIAGAIFGYPWSPPLDSHLIQICGCVVMITHGLTLYLGGKPVDPASLARARSRLHPL